MSQTNSTPDSSFQKFLPAAVAGLALGGLYLLSSARSKKNRDSSASDEQELEPTTMEQMEEQMIKQEQKQAELKARVMANNMLHDTNMFIIKSMNPH